jgi:hypothetical protein
VDKTDGWTEGDLVEAAFPTGDCDGWNDSSGKVEVSLAKGESDGETEGTTEREGRSLVVGVLVFSICSDGIEEGASEGDVVSRALLYRSIKSQALLVVW